MDQANALAFINLLNQMRPFVPPIYFDAITSSAVAAALLAIANGANGGAASSVCNEAPVR